MDGKIYSMKFFFSNLTKEQAEEKERELINKYSSNNFNYGYNIESGGYTNFAKN